MFYLPQSDSQTCIRYLVFISTFVEIKQNYFGEDSLEVQGHHIKLPSDHGISGFGLVLVLKQEKC